MTCTLRYIDVRYLLPKRLAFAEAVDNGEVAVAGHVVAKSTGSSSDEVVAEGDKNDGVRKTATVSVKGDSSKL